MTRPDVIMQCGFPAAPAPDGRVRPGRKAPARHGTPAGFVSHYYRRDLPPCEPCKRAQASYQKNRGAP